MNFRTLDGLAVKGKRVLVRADLNVPMADGKVTDHLRIERQAPTIRELADKGAKVIMPQPFRPAQGQGGAVHVAEAGGARRWPRRSAAPVAFAADCVGPEAEAAVADAERRRRAAAGKHPLSSRRGKERSRLLPSSWRRWAIFSSMTPSPPRTAPMPRPPGIAELLPSVAGRAMEEELRHLEKALSNPERPVLAVVGGAKVSSKIALLENMVGRVETLVIGGAMANTFLAAEGLLVGKSLYEPEYLDTARKVIHMATESGCAILLPTDVVVAKEFKAGRGRIAPFRPPISPPTKWRWMSGPKTIAAFKKRLETTKTLVWNGPFGAFETPPFDKGTVAAARAVAEATKAGKLLSVAGGGDTVAALAHAGVEDDFTYVSTAGGAFLEWLEGKELPGVEALKA